MTTKAFVQTLAALLLPFVFQAQTQQFALETDPSTFALNGYAIHVRIQPKSFNHLAVGAGLYGLDFPSLMVNMNKVNRNVGWDLRLEHAVGLFGEYYFSERDHKWFVGLQAGLQYFRLQHTDFTGQQSHFHNLLLMPSIGYKWYPFHIPFYLKPWMGIGYTTTLGGETAIGNHTYDVSPLIPFVTLHAGYTFGRK